MPKLHSKGENVPKLLSRGETVPKLLSKGENMPKISYYSLRRENVPNKERREKMPN